MNIQIKNRWTGSVIHEGEYPSIYKVMASALGMGKSLRGANLCDADLCDADLRDADLRGADLRGANLRGADLRGANLCDANLCDADLRDADLRDANLCDANLCDANLRDADLCDADLRDANLRDANLRGANLRGANLRDADLCDAKNLSPLMLAKLSIIPESGDVVAWKKCRHAVLVKLLIHEGTKRSNSTGRKCRAESVKVLEVIGAEQGVSDFDGSTIYRVGDTVTCDKWNENRFIECGGGIHFFITRVEAEEYCL